MDGTASREGASEVARMTLMTLMTGIGFVVHDR